MNSSACDPRLLEIVSAPVPATISEVVGIMQAIDALLPGNDGLKWFNWLYLQVTQAIDAQPQAGGWSDAVWLTRLDVVFAHFYFAAIESYLSHPAKTPQAGPSSDTALAGPPAAEASTPSSWQALFEARLTPDIDRIQFALAGMNAHINHDLALALIETNRELAISPGLDSPEHTDFECVNGLLRSLMPATLNMLATGVVGELAQDTGKVGRLLAFWDICAARDLAWGFADHLTGLNDLPRAVALDVQDKLTGVIGRSLLMAV
jgi:hypothetical protein